MSHVELPRPLEDYFSCAEGEKRGATRRFTITLPYLAGETLGRMQWWWRVSGAQENLIGDAGVAALKLREIERFRRHIERWLANTGQRLHGDEPIPRIAALTKPAGHELPDHEPLEDKPAGADTTPEERRYA